MYFGLEQPEELIRRKFFFGFYDLSKTNARKGESFQKNIDFVDEKFLLCLFPEINFQII